MPPRPANIHLGRDLSPREGAIDAIYRFTEALDRADEDLMRSAFTSDAVFDLSGLTPCTGLTYDEKKGADVIVKDVLAHIGPMDTVHHLSNFRVKMNPEQTEAEVTCYAIAQHFKAGQAHDPSQRGSLIMGNSYWVDVVKDASGKEPLWRMRRFEVTNMWSEGDLSVLV